jgi:signal transduction histidine kinase
MIRDNVTRLTVLVEDILDISRIDSGRDALRVAEVDVAEVLKEAVDKQRNRPQHKDKTREIDVEIDPLVPHIQADRGKLLRIFNSIVDNAFNYTQDGGIIHVRAQMDTDRVLITIADNGVGIPEQYREMVWRRFQRIEEHALKLEVSGTGLGLSIVKEMVDMHNGDVWFDSQVGKGTTFTVALPLVQPGQAVAALAP